MRIDPTVVLKRVEEIERNLPHFPTVALEREVVVYLCSQLRSALQDTQQFRREGFCAGAEWATPRATTEADWQEASEQAERVYPTREARP